MIMWHCKHKEMSLSTSYKNVKTSLRILRLVMFLVKKIQAKSTFSGLLRKIPPLRNMSSPATLMSIPTTLQGYNDGSLIQKDNGLKHNTPITDL